jgi:signal transduction histidine kinase
MPRNPVVLLPSALQPTVIHFWQRGWFQILLLSFCAVVAAICLRLLAQLALQSKAQQVLQRERIRIARDIHDELGASLTHLVLLGETAKREPVTETGAQTQFDRITETGRKLLRAIDEVVWMVNSQRDSLQDFEAYVCRYAENFLRMSGIQCRLHVDDEMPRAMFDLASRRSLFLAVKESLNNIAKHANATIVSLTIKLVNEEVLVTVEDNGHGFDPAKRDLGRNGLTNMMNRMAELGGRCHVTSQPGAGCKLELAAPRKPRAPKTRRGTLPFFRRASSPPPNKITAR